MSISATVTSQQPITATVSASGVVSAKIPAGAIVGATVTGGVGPQGPQGPVGPAGSNTLANLTDVQLDGADAGDLLRFSDGKWRDFNESNVTIDGANF